MTEPIVHLSSLVGSPLLDTAGERLGRVEDVIVRLDTGDQLPPVTGLKVRIGGRELFVPADRIEHLEAHAARVSSTKLDLGQFARRPGEVLLRADVLGRSMINVSTARLVKAHDVELVCQEGRWRVAGIDPALGARLRRFLPARVRPDEQGHAALVPWSQTEPFVGHVPASRLRLAPRRLARLHPAQIADLVEAASHEEGEEIMQAVGQDKELEADVFEELDDEHQVEFLKERSNQEIAAVLARMATDDAADLLLEIEQDRRLPVLNLVPIAKRRKIKGVLGYNPSTAGGLMNPDVATLPASARVDQALEYVRTSELAPAQLLAIWVVDDHERLVGGVFASELVKADRAANVTTLIETRLPAISPDTELPEVARLMADFNLIAMPIIDEAERPIGVVSFDDVLELLVPEEWRRRAGDARG